MTLIGISADPIEELASWARDADFPFLFASDPEAGTFRSFGVGVRGSGVTGHRMLAVVDPEGTVSYVASPFREIDPTAYDELQAAVEAVAPPLDADEEVGDGSPDAELDGLLPAGDC